MQKVLYISHYADLLGANRSLLSLVRGMKDKKLYSPIIILPREGELSIELRKYNIQYYVVSFYPSVYEKKGFLEMLKANIKEIINISASIKVALHFRKRGICLIHTNSSVSNLGAYISFFLKIPHIWHFREFAKLHYHLFFNIGYKLQLKIWKNCSDRVITISNALREYYTPLLYPSKIVTIYNGIEFDRKLEVKHSGTFFHIALVGVVHPGKHQDIVIRAISKIVNELKIRNVHLHVYGQCIDEEYQKTVNDLIIDRNLENFVTLHGYQTNIDIQIRTCNIGVLASEYEAFGRVTIEYMANGLIPIVSNSGANTEIVKDGINGLVFELNNVDSLVSRILEVVNGYETMSWMLENAKESAEKYSIEAIIEQVVLLYNQIGRR